MADVVINELNGPYAVSGVELTGVAADVGASMNDLSIITGTEFLIIEEGNSLTPEIIYTGTNNERLRTDQPRHELAADEFGMMGPFRPAAWSNPLNLAMEFEVQSTSTLYAIRLPSEFAIK